MAQNIPLTKIQKGQYPHSEMYGIIKPEYSLHDHTNLDLLQEIATYDKIVIAGEAKSHCVLEVFAKFANIILINQKLLVNYIS